MRSAILAIGDDVVLWPWDNDTARKSFTETMTQADLRFACCDYLGRLANKTLGMNLPYDVVMMGAEYSTFKPAGAAEKTALRRQYNVPEDRIVIFMAGTAVKRKGWIDLMDALAEVKKAGKDFVLVGAYTGNADFVFADEVKMRGLEANWMPLGEVPPANLDQLYKLADIFCLPSHSEGMANVVIEAMSSGLATITTNVCGHPELVTDGQNGLLVPPREPQLLTAKLSELISNKELRDRLGKNARDFIVNQWGDYKKNTKGLYEKLVAAR